MAHQLPNLELFPVRVNLTLLLFITHESKSYLFKQKLSLDDEPTDDEPTDDQSNDNQQTQL